MSTFGHLLLSVLAVFAIVGVLVFILVVTIALYSI